MVPLWFIFKVVEWSSYSHTFRILHQLPKEKLKFSCPVGHVKILMAVDRVTQ